MLKDAPHRLSAAFPVITMGQMVRHTGLSPKKIIFLELTTLKNANLRNFGPKITVLAYFELIRQLVNVLNKFLDGCSSPN